MPLFFLSQTGLSPSQLIFLLLGQFSPCFYAPFFLRLTNDALFTLSFFEVMLLLFPYIYLKKKQENYKILKDNLKKTENPSPLKTNHQKGDLQKIEKQNMIQKNCFRFIQKENNGKKCEKNQKNQNHNIAKKSDSVLFKKRIWKRAYFLTDFDSRLRQTTIGTGLLLMFFFGMILVYAGILEFKSSLISKLNLPMRFNMPYLLCLGVVFGVINPVVEEIYWRIFLRKTYKDNIFSLILINISYSSYHFFVVE